MPQLDKIHFKGSQAYHRWLTDPARVPNRHHSYEGYGCTPTDLKTGLDMLTNGNPNTQAIRDLMNKFKSDLVETPQRITRRSTSGHRVSVGAYLSGNPNNMYKRYNEPSDRAPVRIWVGTTSSIGIRPSEVTRRGAALAAFAMALSVTRAVTITVYSLISDYRTTDQIGIISTDLSTSPLYINELAAHMDVHLTRYVGMYACHCISPHVQGGWGRGYDDTTPGGKLSKMLGAGPNDILLKGIHLNDPLLTDPIKWINENLAKYANPH